MAKYSDERNTVFSIQGINAELEKVANTQDDHLSRKSGDSPNMMETDLDMNSSRIFNLPDPVTDNEPLTKAYGEGILDGATEQANRAEAEADRAELEANNAADSAEDARVAADNIGYTFLDPLTFETGATLEDPNEALLWSTDDGGNGEYYRWAGSFPKEVVAGSTPLTSGGIGKTQWRALGSAVLRDQLTSEGNSINDIGGAALKTTSPYNKRTQNKAVVSFIFDDSTTTAIGAIEPAFDSRGITCGIAPFSNGFNVAGKMDLTKLLSLQNKGYEILSHGDSLVTVAAGANAANIELELRQSYEKMRGLGLNIKGFVPLQSELDPAYIPTMMRYYTYGFPYYKGDATGVSALQDQDLDPSNLFRTNLWSVGLAAAKNIVDLAISNSGYVQFYDHDPTQVTFPNSMPTADLEELLDYCQAQGVDIVNPSDAIDRLHSSTIKTVAVRKSDSEAAKGSFSNRQNLLVDSQFADFINISGNDGARNWVATPSGTAASFSVMHYGTGSEIRLDPDGVSVGQQLIILNKKTKFKDYPHPSSLCFSVELRGTQQMTNRYDVTVEIQIRNISDDSVVDSASSGLVDVDLTSAKRFYAAVDVPDQVSGGFYAQCFVRSICNTASTNGILILRKPMLNEGRMPAVFVDSEKTLPVTSISANLAATEVDGSETKLASEGDVTNGSVDIASSGDITINRDGTYNIDCSVNLLGTSAGERLVVFPKLNGIDMKRYQSFTGGTQNQVSFTLSRKFNAGDVINFYALQTAGVNRTVSSDLYSSVTVSSDNNLN